ncbi:DUF6197 family protein [Bradyrhizobium sp. PMVTL-01]|uniref:DUF6197 family protein n=1 Tax=Bradyrhizobium sp. PMVTL-01 TaxID=3434999 RepID=UPI003F71F269
MKSIKQIIIDARALIADKEHWIQDETAQDRDGASCEPNDTQAYCFCAQGALIRAYGGDLKQMEWIAASDALERAAKKLFPDSADKTNFAYVRVNDGEVGAPDDPDDANLAYDLAHENILKVFDLAIAEAA